MYLASSVLDPDVGDEPSYLAYNGDFDAMGALTDQVHAPQARR